MEQIAKGIWKKRIGIHESITPVAINENLISEEALEHLGRTGKVPFTDSDVNSKINDRGCIIEIPLMAYEKIFGFGLQLKSFNQTGKKKYLRTNADPIADTGDTHAPVPFYVSTAGYGVYVDTARYVSFYCGSSRKQGEENRGLSKRTAVIANNTEDLYSKDNMSEDEVMLIEVPYAKGVDVYFFEGPDIKTAVQRYNLFSGGGCLPPMWGLGILYRLFGRADQEKALELAESFRKDGIPCDIIGMEPGWQSHSYSCSYTWDKLRFPEPEAIIKKLKEMNYKINLWEHVFVHPTSPIYEDLKPYSGDYEVWKGLVPDLNIKQASRIFSQYHREQLVERGIDGFKLDECDSSDYTGGWSFPNCSEFPSGMDGEQMHSLLGTLYQKTILSAISQTNRRTYGQVRSSHAQAASLPFVLYSDLYDHSDFIRGVVNAGFSGLLWTPEVRQCETVEDLVRRLQTVIFSPQACINAWMIPNPPWLQFDHDKNLKGELLDNWKEVQNMCKGILELRMSFIPYLYSSFAKYHSDGTPPFRALVMDYPQDTNTYVIDDQYMMGDSVLVAPVVAGKNTREVYLPEGNWYSFWNSKKYYGSKRYEIKVELEQIPVFIKENTLLPLANPIENVLPDTCFDIVVQCYGEQCEPFTLYEDDGVSYDYIHGSYNHVLLTWKAGSCHSVDRKGNFQGIRYRIIVWKDMVHNEV